MDLNYRKATIEDIDLLTKTRIEVLRAANGLSDDTDMTEVEHQSYEYYRKALHDNTHTAYLVFDGDRFVGDVADRIGAADRTLRGLDVPEIIDGAVQFDAAAEAVLGRGSQADGNRQEDGCKQFGRVCLHPFHKRHKCSDIFSIARMGPRRIVFVLSKGKCIFAQFLKTSHQTNTNFYRNYGTQNQSGDLRRLWSLPG